MSGKTFLGPVCRRVPSSGIIHYDTELFPGDEPYALGCLPQGDPIWDLSVDAFLKLAGSRGIKPQLSVGWHIVNRVDGPPTLDHFGRDPVSIKLASWADKAHRVSPMALSLDELQMGANSLSYKWLSFFLETMVVANVLLNTSDRNKSVIRTDLDESKMWTSAIEATMGVPVMDLIQNKSLERTGKRLDGVGNVGIRLTPKRLGIQLVQFRLFGNGILLDEARYLPKTRFAETIIAYGRLLPMEEAMTIEKESLSTHRNSR